MLIPYNLRFCIKKHRYIICCVGQKLKTELRERFWSCSNWRRYTGLLHPNTGQHKILSLVHLINQIGQRDKTKNDVWLHKYQRAPCHNTIFSHFDYFNQNSFFGKLWKLPFRVFVELINLTESIFLKSSKNFQKGFKMTN